MGYGFYRRQIAVFSTFLALLASSSRAAGTVTAAPRPGATNDPTYLPWSDGQTYEECGQTCLLQKANENLSLQALYILNRINTLQGMATSGDSVQQDTLVNKELANLCPDVSVSDAGANTCFQRYVRVQVVALRQMKTAIANNQNSLIGYRSDVQAVGGDGTIQRKAVSPNTVAQYENGPKKKVQTTYVTDLASKDDVNRAYESETKEMKYLASEPYQKWVEEDRPHQPNKEDFYNWKSVPLDPQNTSLGKVSVLQNDKNGNPAYDVNAYNAAMLEYKSRMSDLNSVLANKSIASSPRFTPHREVVTDTQVADYKSSRDQFLGTAQTPVQPAQKTGARGDLGRTLASSKTKAPSASQTQVFTSWDPAALEKEIQSAEAILPECQGAKPCYADQAPAVTSAKSSATPPSSSTSASTNTQAPATQTFAPPTNSSATSGGAGTTGAAATTPGVLSNTPLSTTRGYQPDLTPIPASITGPAPASMLGGSGTQP
jgi:hypothetical protein